MVKLQDLVDLDEPPLGWSSTMLSSGKPKDTVMELDDDDEEQEEDILGIQYSTGEANLRLG